MKFYKMVCLAASAAAIFAAVLGVAPCRAELADRILAVVNDDIILLSDLEQMVTPYREKLMQTGYSESQVRSYLAEQRSAILEQMIVDKLTDQQAKRHGITVDEKEIDNTIERISKVNNMPRDQLLRMLKLEGLTYEAYRKQVKEQMLRARLVNVEVKSKIIITDDEVTAYYAAHQDQYAGQTKYQLRHILMRVTSQSQEERERVHQQMQSLYQRLQSGEQFSELAKLYSQADTAADGGNLGSFESRLLAASVRDALQGLKAGQFTPVLETEQGYQIFYIEEIVQTGGKPLAEIKPEIQDKLFAEEVDRNFKEWVKELRKKAHIQIMD